MTTAFGLIFLLGAMAGCTTAGRDDRQSGITVYGTVDSAIDVTR